MEIKVSQVDPRTSVLFSSFESDLRTPYAAIAAGTSLKGKVILNVKRKMIHSRNLSIQLRGTETTIINQGQGGSM
jgi:hypothetical protein